MMLRRILVIGTLLTLTAASQAIDVSPGQLDTNPDTWNGVRVALTGELIGDYGARSDFVWVQLNEDPYVDAPLRDGGSLQGANSGVGLRIPMGLFDDSAWGLPGRYRHRGPIVRIEGTFKYHDPATLGETYVAVDMIELIEPSKATPARHDLWPFVVGIALLISGAGMTIVARRRHRRLGLL
jgi:hypothetical protein